MPVTVGLFVTPGNAAGRNNRSFEYDAMTDDSVRFLSDELLPYVAKTHKLKLSTDGNDRAIAGISSGGICAFTAAWERPDAFRRVFSNVVWWMLPPLKRCRIGCACWKESHAGKEPFRTGGSPRTPRQSGDSRDG